MAKVDAIINVYSFDVEKNPHFESIIKENLWGVPPHYKGNWEKLEPSSRVLVYGDKGIRVAGIIEQKFEKHEPIKYWVNNPTGYPYQFTMKLLNEESEVIQPIDKEKLVKTYKINAAKRDFFQVGMLIFPDEKINIKTKYKRNTFDKIWSEFTTTNNIGNP